MPRTRFERDPCPIARTTDLLDAWSPMIMREAFFGRKRFDEFQRALGVSRAVLAQRLQRLAEAGLLRRERYQEHPPRDEYLLTEKGAAFFDVLAAMWRFGSDWMWSRGGPPIELVDAESRAPIEPVVVDEHTGERIDVRRLRVRARTT